MSETTPHSEKEQEIRNSLEPFLRAADHYADGNPGAASQVLHDRINARPITEDDDELGRAWAMIAVGAVVTGAEMRNQHGDPDPGSRMSEDSYWAIQLTGAGGEHVSLDEVLEPDQANAFRVVAAGANHDHEAVSGFVRAAAEQRGPEGVLSLLGELLLLFSILRGDEPQSF